MEPTICGKDHERIAFFGKECPLCKEIELFSEALKHINALTVEIARLSSILGYYPPKLPKDLPANLRFIDQKKKKGPN